MGARGPDEDTLLDTGVLVFRRPRTDSGLSCHASLGVLDSARLSAIELDWELVQPLGAITPQRVSRQAHGTSAGWTATDPGGEVLVRRLRAGPLRVREAWDLLAALLAALARLDGADIVHRRLSPSRVLWDPDRRSVGLLGFDSAVLPGTVVDGMGRLALAEVPFVAPEASGRLRLPITPAADLYSIGACLFAAFTGRAPFSGPSALDVFHAQVTSPPEPLERALGDAPASLRAMIIACLATDPSARPASAAALQSWVDSARGDVDPGPLPRRGAPTRRPLDVPRPELARAVRAAFTASAAEGPRWIELLSDDVGARAAALSVVSEVAAQGRVRMASVRFGRAPSERLPGRFAAALTDLLRRLGLSVAARAEEGRDLASALLLPRQPPGARVRGVLILEDLDWAEPLVVRQISYLVARGGLPGLIFVSTGAEGRQSEGPGRESLRVPSGRAAPPGPPRAVSPRARQLLDAVSLAGGTLTLGHAGAFLGWPTQEARAAAVEAQREGALIVVDDAAGAGRQRTRLVRPRSEDDRAPAAPDDEEAARRRRRLGQIIWGSGEGDLEDRIDALMLLAGLAGDDAERRTETAQRLLQASEDCMACGAASLGAAFAEQARALVEDGSALGDRARLSAARAYRQLGNLPQVEDVTRPRPGHTFSTVAERELWSVRLATRVSAGALEGALADGVQILEALGFPLRVDNPKARSGYAIARLALGMTRARIRALRELPPATDPAVLAALATLSQIAPAVMSLRPEATPLAVLHQLALTEAHGLSDDAPYCIVGCVFLFGELLNDHARARLCGEVASDLADRIRDPRRRARARFVVGLYFHQLYAPPHTLVPHFDQCARDSRSANDLEYSGFATSTALWERLWSGEPLHALRARAQVAMSEFRALGHETVAGWLLPVLSFAARLTGEEVHPAAEEDAARADPTGPTGRWSRAWMRCWAAVLEHDVEGAAAAADEAWAIIELGRGTKGVPAFLGYAVVAWSRAGRPQRTLRRALARLSRTEGMNPAEVRHRVLLARGAVESSRAHFSRAASHWSDALEHARAVGFVHDIGLLHEQLAHAHDAMGQRSLARLHREQALETWRVWGASRCARRVASLLEGDRPASRPAPEDASSRALIEAVTAATRLVRDEPDLAKLIPRLVDLSLRLAGADRAGLVLTGPEGAFVSAVIDSEGRSVPEPGPLAALDGACPVVALRQALESGESISASDARERSGDPYLVDNGVRSLLVSPLELGGDRIGAIWFENRRSPGLFAHERAPVLHLFSQQLASVVQTARLLDETRKVRDAYARFVPTELIGLIGAGAVETLSPGQHTVIDVPVLFSDIRDFTGHSERLGPEGAFDLIQAVLGAVEPVVRRHGGLIEKYVGDAVVALFPSGSVAATSAAVEMIRAVRALDTDREGFPPLELGIGINSGVVTVGAVGTERRLDTAILSDAVNVAARLEGLTKRYGAPILVTRAVADALPADSLLRRPLERVRIRGRERSEMLFEVFEADEPTVREDKRATLDRFTRATTLAARGQQRAARGELAELVAAHPLDSVAARLLVLTASRADELPAGSLPAQTPTIQLGVVTEDSQEPV